MTKFGGGRVCSVIPKHALVGILALLMVHVPSASAQIAHLSKEPHLKTDNQTAIHVDSDLVLIPVTVLDGHDESVSGLEKEHFKVFEDKIEQVITHFAMEDAPISVGFVFDASASMRLKMEKSREAVSRFLSTANPDDEFFVVQFNDVVELLADLTTSTQEIQRQITFARAAGRTALLDAIHFSLEHLRKARNARKALIIVSDGGDNCSRYTLSEVKTLVRESDAQIYALGIFDSFDSQQTPEELAGPSLLRGIADQSGGRLFQIVDVKQLPDIAFKISAALRAQYVLGYSPKPMMRDGKYHRVDVKLSRPRGFRKLRASWRRGYYAPVD